MKPYKLHIFCMMANNQLFVDAHREEYKELIESEKKNKPKECMECLFFRWNETENGYEARCTLLSDTIKCARNRRTEGCPLDREDEDGDHKEKRTDGMPGV